MLLLVFGLVFVSLYLFYRWTILHYDFFEKRGIPYEKPFPLFGNMTDVVLRKKNMFYCFRDLYKNRKGKIYGVFDQRTPMYMISDPELIKQITIKDFDHFINHRAQFGDGKTDLFSNSVFFLRDDKWKDMRNTLTPAYTGSKMRQMFKLMNNVASETTKCLKKMESGKSDKGNGIELDLKDFCTSYTNDIIASTAFGLQTNSIEDPSNEFYLMGKKVTTFTPWQNLKFFLYANFRIVMKILKLEIMEKEKTDYFMRIVLDAMKYRREHHIVRPDMIQMLMEAQEKPTNRNWSDFEIVAQCFLFFFAGFENTALAMCFTAHELMENQEIQQKLYEEIAEVERDLNGEALTYEALHGMKYLDMVINEMLRKWPGAIILDRVCNTDFTYMTEDGERLEMKKGETLWIPVVGLHYDPQYFPNPNKFDPERFSEENKDNIVPFTYLPFGAGPRNCIGSRFALLEIKAMVYHLVKEFHIEASKKSSIPLTLSPKFGFQLKPENGFWLKFTSRQKI